MTLKCDGILGTSDAVPFLDSQVLSEFNESLEAKHRNSESISCAKLVSGHEFCIVSTPRCAMIDGVEILNLQEHRNLERSFICMHFLGLEHAVDVVMHALQLDNAETETEAANNYAAAVLICHNVQFLCKILRGFLRNLLPVELTKALITWAESLKKELKYYFQDGCGRFLSWQDPIEGSMKQFRKHRTGKDPQMTIDLQQNMRFSEYNVDWPSVPPGSFFNESGACLAATASISPRASLPMTDADHDESPQDHAFEDLLVLWLYPLDQYQQQSPAFGDDSIEQMPMCVPLDATTDSNLESSADSAHQNPGCLFSNSWENDPEFSFTTQL